MAVVGVHLSLGGSHPWSHDPCGGLAFSPPPTPHVIVPYIIPREGMDGPLTTHSAECEGGPNDVVKGSTPRQMSEMGICNLPTFSSMFPAFGGEHTWGGSFMIVCESASCSSCSVRAFEPSGEVAQHDKTSRCL